MTPALISLASTADITMGEDHRRKHTIGMSRAGSELGLYLSDDLRADEGLIDIRTRLEL
jgi:hypothetical protein